MRIAGAILVALGFAALIAGGVPYRKTENVAEIGGFKMQVTEKKEFAIPPLVGGIAIALGAAMLFARRRGAGA
ncbi:MAG TPA: hypothetical protein VGK89_02925 [Candidatus Eisenbacteria bacterium]|jgi:hypothetical protein